MRSAWIKGLVIAGAAAALVGCTLAPGARLALVCYDDTGATVSSFNGGFVITDIADSDAETAFAVAIAPWVYDVHVDDERTTEGNLAVAGDAGLLVERLGFNGRGMAIEFSQSWYRGDTYDFVAELSISD